MVARHAKFDMSEGFSAERITRGPLVIRASIARVRQALAGGRETADSSVASH